MTHETMTHKNRTHEAMTDNTEIHNTEIRRTNTRNAEAAKTPADQQTRAKEFRLPPTRPWHDARLMQMKRQGRMTAARPAWLMTALCTLLVAGCLEREEAITVAPDGTVKLSMHYKGTREEFDTLHASPFTKDIQPKTGSDKEWEVSQSWQYQKHEPLPTTYAVEEKDTHLQFPTQVTITESPDGTYYTVRRTYQPRSWNYVNYWQREFLQNDEIKKLAEKDSQTLTTQERMKVVLAFAHAEALRQVEMADRAWAQAAPESDTGKPLRAHLMARRALLACYQEQIVKDRIEPCLSQSEQNREVCLAQRGDAIIADAQEKYFETLADNAESWQVDAAYRAFENEKRYHQVTSDTGAHAFDITVTLPGRIVEHNALDADIEDVKPQNGEQATPAQSVSWQFTGAAFRDRPYELVAVSFLPARQ